jgi:hypothetical protein
MAASGGDNPVAKFRAIKFRIRSNGDVHVSLSIGNYKIPNFDIGKDETRDEFKRRLKGYTLNGKVVFTNPELDYFYDYAQTLLEPNRRPPTPPRPSPIIRPRPPPPPQPPQNPPNAGHQPSNFKQGGYARIGRMK